MAQSDAQRIRDQQDLFAARPEVAHQITGKQKRVFRQVGGADVSPMARGRLTRDWDAASARAETDAFGRTLYANTAEADRKVVEAVAQVAAARGVPRAQVALAWVLQQPGVTAPIVGATRVEHLDDAVAALSLTLTPEETAALEAPYVPHAVVGFS